MECVHRLLAAMSVAALVLLATAGELAAAETAFRGLPADYKAGLLKLSLTVQERAAAFNARQRSFWAAVNLPGAPKPGAAGAKESMIVEGLPAGKLTFGIKSWDAFDNMSELSNVVQAEVK